MDGDNKNENPHGDGGAIYPNTRERNKITFYISVFFYVPLFIFAALKCFTSLHFTDS